MTIRVVSSRLRLRPPDAAAFTDITAGAAGAKPVMAVDDFTVEWGRPTPLVHPDPGQIQFSLLVDPGVATEALLAYDTELIFDAILKVRGAAAYVTNVAPTRLAHGWISTWTRTTQSDGRYLYRVTALDVLGRAAATKLGANPWPREVQSARVAHINAASKAGALVNPPFVGSNIMGPRDVNAADALGIIRATCRVGTMAVEGPDLVEIQIPTTNLPTYWEPATMFMSSPTNLVKIPAGIIEDAGRRLDRSATITEIGVTAYPDALAQGEPVTTTYYNPARGFTSSRLTITSDTAISNVNVAAWTQAVMAAAAQPAVMLQPAQVAIERDVGRVYTPERLIDIVSRHETLVMLLDCPPEVDAVQVITRGRLTIRGSTSDIGRLDLDVSLMPARLFGTRGLKFNEISQVPAERPRLKGGGTVYGIPIKTRINETSVTTLGAPAAFS